MFWLYTILNSNDVKEAKFHYICIQFRFIHLKMIYRIHGAFLHYRDAEVFLRTS